MEELKKRSFLLSFLRKRRKREASKKTYIKCRSCHKLIDQEVMDQEAYVCPACGFHNALSAKKRLDLIFDPGYVLLTGASHFRNPLDFPGYEEKIEDNKKASGLEEAILWGHGKISGQEAVAFVMDKSFFMASMGTYVGEEITKAFSYACQRRLPVVSFSASGGARMQEGILSLMQMAKTANAVRTHSLQGLLYINVYTNPTTGGVTASFSSLGDILLAEPGALIAFAGPRVIKQTIGQDLPEGFQRAEFLKDHGFVDKIVHRKDLKGCLGTLLRLHRG